MAQLSMWLMGLFRVTRDGEPVTDFATDKAQALLAYLSVEADQAHRRDFLAGLLWPEQPSENGRQSLRQALYHLRRAIGDRDGNQRSPFLLVSRHTIQFNPQGDSWLDVAAFADLVEGCRQHRHRRQATCLPCLQCMKRMAGLYQGEFLEQFPDGDSHLFEEWVLLTREWLHRQAMDALVHLADYHERRGEIRQARRYARRQVEMEPWREEAHRQLMRLLALDGQRSAALAQYSACRQALADELGVEPTGQTRVLCESIEAGQDAPLALSTSAPLHSLPPSPTPFVGRKEELAELAELLANPDCRLLTLIGPGGIGKSRLALQAARHQIGSFPHGVAFVSLTSVTSPDLLVSAIAHALGFCFHEEQDPEQQLLNYLRKKELLLVLDRMEHMLEAAPLLSKMIQRAPGVVLLVTSQERLNLREEWVRKVEGLTYPAAEAAEGGGSQDSTRSVDLPGAYSAVALFLQQARRVHRRFSLSAENAPDVVQICQLVEGLPLGIELAAAWTPVRSCEEIAEAIERNLDILSTTLRNIPDRQRSIRATFEHSWQSLSQDEKELLTRLSIFRGGFSREAALQVAGASLSALLALADKSLVRRIATNRYDMHGLLVQYAAEKLSDAPDQGESTKMRHARYFAAFLERQEERLRSATGQDDFRELTLEIENACRAWQLAVAHDCAPLIEQGLESLYVFYDVRCRFQEGVKLFAQAIDRWTGDSRHRPILAKLLSRQGALYLQLCQYRHAKATLERSLQICKSLGLVHVQIFCLVNLATLAHRQGEYEKAANLCGTSLALSRQTGDSWGLTHSLLQLGLVRYRAGDVATAEKLLQESLATGQRSGSPRLAIAPLNLLGDIACHRGDYAVGQALFERCLALTRELGDQFKVAVVLNNLGTVLHVLEKLDQAQSAYRESLDICGEIGDRGGQAIALSNLGELAYAAGAYADAERLYRQGLGIGREIDDQWIVMACLNNLGEVAHALEDRDGARQSFAEALTIAQETNTLPMMLKVVVNLAALFALEGETDYAIELLGLARQHPAGEQDTREKAQLLLDEIGLVPATMTDRSLDSVVAEVLTHVT